MKPTTTDQIVSLLDASFAAAALGAALELRLFWLLEERPLDAEGVGASLGVPLNRCRPWLQILAETGLLTQSQSRYAPSATARQAILGAFAQPTWAQLAMEARERLPGLHDLPRHLRGEGSAWDALGLAPSDYIAQMSRDSARARRFTRMLYEIHRPLADILAAHLDLTGVRRLLDLGGGSGVIALALARRNPDLSVVVVDIPNVCDAGREIAREAGLADRVTHHAADFTRDELPGGCDAALECDVGVYDETLFRKVRAALPPGGRFFVVDQFAPAPGVAPPGRVTWALERALLDPESTGFETADEVTAILRAAGFSIRSPVELPAITSAAGFFESGMAVIEASA